MNKRINTTYTLITAICFTFMLLAGCQPRDVSMTIITKGTADDVFMVKNTTLKPLQKNIAGIYAKVVSATEVGYVKGEGILFDGMVEINGNHYPARFTREANMSWDKNKAPKESVIGPYPGENVLVVSINGVYYDNIEGLRIKPPNQTQ